ncbi:cation diffusion facilitator family transporter [Galbibacter sp. PAP.153]|uniref:cation diffusion facilitator family transporter n=1 Tax=Galbibacter sp. PAP.153 TaxID=3104623 RepID=UPI0030084029
MKITGKFALPPYLQETLKKAIFYEWLTVGYLLTVIVLMFLVMGSSQAMKTAWLEDALSILPAISFLIASRLYNKPATKEFPYGFHKVFSIAFLTGSVALFAMGCFLAIDAAIILIKAERPTIGSVYVFNTQIWMGWLMMLTLCYSAFPAMWLGYKKMPLAKKMHNKILFTDATTQKADYMTAFAAIIGILGVGFGIWWADASAALFISISVIKDGFKGLKNAIADLMDRHPMDVKNNEKDNLVEEIKKLAKQWPWAKQVRVRFREHGMVYFGELYIIPMKGFALDGKIEAAKDELLAYHWKIHDVTIMVEDTFDENVV